MTTATRSYDAVGFYVAASDPEVPGFAFMGDVRHFHFARNAAAFVGGLGGRVVLLSRRFADEPAEMSLEQLEADGWPPELYSTTSDRIF